MHSYRLVLLHADPPPPPPPQLIRHEHGDNDAGELHVKLLPLEDNPFGPITSYRVVVINETDDNPIPFSTENLAPWKTANEIGLRCVHQVVSLTSL